MGTGWFFDSDKAILVFLLGGASLTRRNVSTSEAGVMNGMNHESYWT